MGLKIVLNKSLSKRTRFEKMTFSMEEVEVFSSPGVYVFYLNDEALYVGSGKAVMGRCMGLHHRNKVRKIADRVEIHPCATHEQALAKEQRLIRELRPKFNGQRKERELLETLTHVQTANEKLQEIWP